MLVKERIIRSATKNVERNSSIRLAQRSPQETDFEFTTRVFGEYFDLHPKDVRYFSRQIALTLNVEASRIPERIRLMAHFFEVTPRDAVSFLRFFHQYHTL